MGKKKRNKIVERRSRKEKYPPSKAILNEQDVRAVVNAPIIHKANTETESFDHIQIINGVVCSTGRYSRLYEDYDDK